MAQLLNGAEAFAYTFLEPGGCRFHQEEKGVTWLGGRVIRDNLVFLYKCESLNKPSRGRTGPPPARPSGRRTHPCLPGTELLLGFGPEARALFSGGGQASGTKEANDQKLKAFVFLSGSFFQEFHMQFLKMPCFRKM